MTQHTAGPWTTTDMLVDGTFDIYRVEDDNTEPEAIASTHSQTAEDNEANARLIAAAPDLLAAANAVANIILADMSLPAEMVINAAQAVLRAAIAKAVGA